MWAWIHWLTDHTNGVLLGKVVARLVLRQMIDMLKDEEDDLCVQPKACPEVQQPPPADLSAKATAFRDRCQPEDRPADECLPQPSTACPDIDPCPAPDLALERLSEDAQRLFNDEVTLGQLSRSPQQGGALPPRVIRRRAGAAVTGIRRSKAGRPRASRRLTTEWSSCRLFGFVESTNTRTV